VALMLEPAAPSFLTLHLEEGNNSEERAEFFLQVTDGPDKGLEFTLDDSVPTRTLLGTSPACTLRLSDPSVSRRQAALQVVGGALRVTDLASTNGTFVNGVHIAEAHLYGGEVLRVGETQIRLHLRPEGGPRSLSTESRFGGLLGASLAMRKLYPILRRIADSDVPVIIEGETGTGKEVLAEALHEEGPRAEGPFVVFDCTATPENLLESALFGHERGAFTGAVATRVGVFEQADGGTLLIDEIGDLPLAMQPKLLRAIQRKEVQRVGGSRWIKTNVRIVAATRRDLDREVAAGRFRDDLFFRLNVARIELPPLRDRKGDVTHLASHFWDHLGGMNRPMPANMLARFEDYAWPGNVRELYNMVARFLALGDFASLGSEAEASCLTSSETAREDSIERIIALQLPLPEARQRLVTEFEQRYLAHMLTLHGGNATKAAAASGIARRHFYTLRARADGARA
jgi:DNA-binding NtrC family response regulator